MTHILTRESAPEAPDIFAASMAGEADWRARR